MKNWFIATFVSFGLCLYALQSRLDAAELRIAKHPVSLGFTFGGDFPVSGSIYDGRDNRFQFGPDLSGPFFAFPITFSFGQDVMIMGSKPGIRVPFVIPGLEGLTFGPGVGPVLNWWHYTGNVPVDADVLELGIQLAGVVRYDTPNMPFYLAFTPFSLDFNFWRKIWVSSAYGGASESNSKLGMIYNLLFEMGVRF